MIEYVDKSGICATCGEEFDYRVLKHQQFVIKHLCADCWNKKHNQPLKELTPAQLTTLRRRTDELYGKKLSDYEFEQYLVWWKSEHAIKNMYNSSKAEKEVKEIDELQSRAERMGNDEENMV